MTVRDTQDTSTTKAVPSPKSRILVVDDDTDIAHFLGAILTLDGYEVAEAYNGESGIKLLKEQDFDLIVTDLMMPGIGGLGLITYVRQDENLAILPIIMVTALHDNMNRASALDAGADDVFSKPINRAELLSRVRSLLRIKRANDALVKKIEDNKALLQTLGERLARYKQERENLTQNAIVQIQRETTAKVAAAIWKELENPLTAAINVAQQGLRDGKMSQDNMEKLAEQLRQALLVTSKLEHLATEAIRNKHRANATKPLTVRDPKTPAP
jgi:DNA-binding response OmpR family regulator